MLDYLSNAGIGSKPRFSGEIKTCDVGANIAIYFSSELGEISHEKVFREGFNIVSKVVLELNLDSEIIIEKEISSIVNVDLDLLSPIKKVS